MFTLSYSSALRALSTLWLSVTCSSTALSSRTRFTRTSIRFHLVGVKISGEFRTSTAPVLLLLTVITTLEVGRTLRPK